MLLYNQVKREQIKQKVKENRTMKEYNVYYRKRGNTRSHVYCTTVIYDNMYEVRKHSSEIINQEYVIVKIEKVK